MRPFRVSIHGNSYGLHVERNVMAETHKAALLAVIREIPEDDPAWQWPGWSVQVYHQYEPIIFR